MKLYEKYASRILVIILCIYSLIATIAVTSLAVSYINAAYPSTDPAEPVGTTIVTEPEATIPEENPPLNEPESPTEPVETPVETTPSEPIETTPPSEPTEPEILYFDVPLSKDLQDYIFELCETNSIDPALVVAMIRAESTYNPNTIGDGGDSLGLMQIQPKWHQWRMDKLNCPDLMDPYQNVTVAIDILTGYYETGKSEEWILMAYNGGATYANRKASNGEVSDYAIRVLKYRDELYRGNIDEVF